MKAVISQRDSRLEYVQTKKHLFVFFRGQLVFSLYVPAAHRREHLTVKLENLVSKYNLSDRDSFKVWAKEARKIYSGNDAIPQAQISGWSAWRQVK